MPAPQQPAARRSPPLTWAVLMVPVSTGGSAGAAQSVLTDSQLAGAFVSRSLWAQIVTLLGGTVERSSYLPPAPAAMVFVSLAALLTVTSAAAWMAGAGLIAWRSKRSFGDALAQWGWRGWAWWLLPAVWEAAWVGASLLDLAPLMQLAAGIAPFWFATALAGWLATFCSLAAKPVSPAAKRGNVPGGIPAFVWLAAATYALVYTAMNWQLYFALNLPHGDSAMYEEHLWNLTHGKGFRSYLDQGLFLGEHIQVIHVLLVPLYLLWPSHLLLEACQSAALAGGAIAVFLLGRRHAGSERAGCCLALAYLLYFPLQYLDVSIDLKTFRPMSFSVPLVLFALDQLERGRWRTMLVLLALALSSKEDLAIVIAPLGVWIPAHAWWRSRAPRAARGAQHSVPSTQYPVPGTQYSVPGTRSSVPGPQYSKPGADARKLPDTPLHILIGLTLAVGATLYLVAVVGWVIPAFRSGETVHYSRYFQTFGDTPGEIVHTMLAEPGRVARAFLTVDTLLYAAALLAPLGLLPLLSPGRLVVGLPLFFVLCLNEIARTPQHHFHAPLVPIVVWAAAAGLGNLGRWRASRRTESHSVRDVAENSAGSGRSDTPSRGTPPHLIRWAGHFAWTSALATGLFFSLGPLGIAFWDRASAWHWQKLYVPGERAARFAEIEPLIPRAARVASTDFVHPRFTHHARSYDYSEYPRAVNDNRPGAPPDTDYIVIDKRDRYRAVAPPGRRIDTARDVPEYGRSPESWDVLVDDPYFLVLRRKPVT